MTAFFDGNNILLQKAGFLSCVGLRCPKPMVLIGPVCRLGKSQCKALPILFYSATAMVEMQVCKKHVGDVVLRKSSPVERLCEAVVAMQMIVDQEFGFLFVSYPF